MATILKNKKFYDENAIDIDFLKSHEVCQSHGPRHVPISHALCLQKFHQKADEVGIKLTDEKGALSIDGEKYMYGASVVIPGNNEYNLSVGFRNYNNEQFSFAGSCGANVLICCNSLQTSVIIPSRTRHTVSASVWKLDEKISTIFSRFQEDAKKTIEHIEFMKSVKADDALVGKFILELGRSGRVGNTNIMRVLKEYDNPTLNSKDDTSAWRISNAATYVCTHQISNPVFAADTSKFMHNTLMKIINPDFHELGDVIDISEPVEE